MKKKIDITKKLMEQIEAGKIKIKPAYLILAEKLGVLLLIILLIMATVLIFNIPLFLLKQSGNLAFLSFGSFGILAFLQTLPYFPIAIMLFGLFLTMKLMKYFDISYKRSFPLIAVLILAVVVGGGITLASSRINTRLEHFPGIKGFYQQKFGSNGFLAEVKEIKENSLIVTRLDTGQIIKVFITERTHSRNGENFSEGQNIRIVGIEKDNKFEATGIGVPKMIPPMTRGKVKGFMKFQLHH